MQATGRMIVSPRRPPPRGEPKAPGSRSQGASLLATAEAVSELQDSLDRVEEVQDLMLRAFLEFRVALNSLEHQFEALLNVLPGPSRTDQARPGSRSRSPRRWQASTPPRLGTEAAQP